MVELHSGKNRGNGLIGLSSISIIGVVKIEYFVYDLHVDQYALILTFFEVPLIATYFSNTYYRM